MFSRIDRFFLRRGLRQARVHITREEEESLRCSGSYPNILLMPEWQKAAIKAAIIVVTEDDSTPRSRVDFHGLDAYYRHWLSTEANGGTLPPSNKLPDMSPWIGLAGRGVFWITLLWIVGDSVAASLRSGDVGMAAVKGIFFPITYVVWPWLSGMAWVFLVSIVAYCASTFIGGLRPID